MNILEARNITKYFSVESGFFKSKTEVVKALDGINFNVSELSTLGIVGESGSGKTTLAKIILQLINPTSGDIRFNPEKIKNLRKDTGIVFQNPYASLNPIMNIREIISEPIFIHRLACGEAVKDRVNSLLKQAGLDDTILNRQPIELSGGQRQRICIARALASEPKFIILDEPLSSLDLTVQSEMLDLFIALKESLKLTYIFISHNLAVIKHISDNVIVMEKGRIVEEGSVQDIFTRPVHPYTIRLLESVRGS